MFKIDEDKTINITRGDKATIELKIPIDDDYYEFSVGDRIIFAVYEKKGLDKTPLLYLEKEVTVAGKSFDIDLTSDNTRLGELENKVQEFWYEIQLNDDQTIIGFDEDGAKKFLVYPEGKTDD